MRHVDEAVEELKQDDPVDEERHRPIERHVHAAALRIRNRHPHGRWVELLPPRIALTALALRVHTTRVQLLVRSAD